MKLIIGLGNPGEHYAETRHNIGFRVVQRLAEEWGLGPFRTEFSSLWTKGKGEGRGEGEEDDLVLLLPQTFMNRSGEAVREARDFYRIPTEDLLVAHDDIDLPLGRVKRDFDAGPAGHRGVISLIEVLGTQAFHRVRVGIGRPVRKEEVETFVLSPFTTEEETDVQAALEGAVEAIRQWLKEIP